MKRVFLVSPLSRDVETHTIYARLASLDCLYRGEAPFAGHLLYPQFQDDVKPEERATGMLAGQAWGLVSQLVAVYDDLGISDGMADDINTLDAGPFVEDRSLQRETAIPDERLIDIRHKMGSDDHAEGMALMDRLFPRLFAALY